MDPISNWAEPKSHLMNTRSENFYKVAGGGGVQNYTTLETRRTTTASPMNCLFLRIRLLGGPPCEGLLRRDANGWERTLTTTNARAPRRVLRADDVPLDGVREVVRLTAPIQMNLKAFRTNNRTRRLGQPERPAPRAAAAPRDHARCRDRRGLRREPWLGDQVREFQPAFFEFGRLVLDGAEPVCELL
jgi:hypothetical protein